MDNETWIIEIGDSIIRKNISFDAQRLSDRDQLIYCLWVADYSMRNAGDLQVAEDLYEEYKLQGLEAASRLKLPLAKKLFSLSNFSFR